MNYAMLQSIHFGFKIVVRHMIGSDPTVFSDGTPAYLLLGYADTVEDAYLKLSNVK